METTSVKTPREIGRELARQHPLTQQQREAVEAVVRLARS